MRSDARARIDCRTAAVERGRLVDRTSWSVESWPDTVIGFNGNTDLHIRQCKLVVTTVLVVQPLNIGYSGPVLKELRCVSLVLLTCE
jgi:hypothetical protein